MVYDFKEGWGRHDETGAERYSDSDLWFGIEWAKWLIEGGFEFEPFHDYNLRAFIEWAREKLNEHPVLGEAQEGP
jgi:hypothetical protein